MTPSLFDDLDTAQQAEVDRTPLYFERTKAPSIKRGAIVRRTGQRGLFRVLELSTTEDAATVYGGPYRQVRTFRLAELRPAGRAEADRFARLLDEEHAAARGIRPARSLR